MSATRTALGLALITAIIGYAVSGEAKPKMAAQSGIVMPATDIIAGRKAGMLMSAALVGTMKSALDRSEDPKTLTFAATGLANWAKATAGQFPTGSEGGEAKPAIWSDAPGFKATADQYVADTAALLAATKSGDKVAVAQSWAKVRTNCAACHSKYKSG